MLERPHISFWRIFRVHIGEAFIQNRANALWESKSNPESFVELYLNSFPGNIQSLSFKNLGHKTVTELAINVWHFLTPVFPQPSPIPFLWTAPPVSPTSWTLCITSWRHALALCGNKFGNFKKFGDNLRRTKGLSGWVDRGRVTGASLHRTDCHRWRLPI